HVRRGVRRGILVGRSLRCRSSGSIRLCAGGIVSVSVSGCLSSSLSRSVGVVVRVRRCRGRSRGVGVRIRLGVVARGVIGGRIRVGRVIGGRIRVGRVIRRRIRVGRVIRRRIRVGGGVSVCVVILIIGLDAHSGGRQAQLDQRVVREQRQLQSPLGEGPFVIPVLVDEVAGGLLHVG